MLNKKMKIIISRLEKIGYRELQNKIKKLKPHSIRELLNIEDNKDFLLFCKTWGLVSKKELVIEPIIKKEKSVTLQALRQRKFRKKEKEKNIKVLSIKIEDETKAKFKINCIREKKTMNKKINELIKKYLIEEINNVKY